MDFFSLCEISGAKARSDTEQRLASKRKGKYISPFVRRQQELEIRARACRRGRLVWMSKPLPVKDANGDWWQGSGSTYRRGND